MFEHLGYNKYERSENKNCRNDNYKKNLIAENGSIKLNIPRDRENKFAPVIVSKNQARIDDLNQKITSLYAKGMSLCDIKIQLQELYVIEVSESLISRITDDVIDEVGIWQGRALEPLYSIVYFDCVVVKGEQGLRNETKNQGIRGLEFLGRRMKDKRGMLWKNSRTTGDGQFQPNGSMTDGFLPLLNLQEFSKIKEAHPGALLLLAEPYAMTKIQEKGLSKRRIYISGVNLHVNLLREYLKGV